jgi:hypothetical protein
MRTYTVAGHYLSALVNNDRTGLDSTELQSLNGWLEREGVSTCLDADTEGVGYARCEVSGLMGDCYEVVCE